MGSVEYRQVSYFLFIITIKVARSNSSIIPKIAKRNSFGLKPSPEAASGFIVVATVLDAAITVLVVVSAVVVTGGIVLVEDVLEVVLESVVLELVLETVVLTSETVVLVLLLVVVDSSEGSVVLVVVESSEMLKSIVTRPPAFHWAVCSMRIPST